MIYRIIWNMRKIILLCIATLCICTAAIAQPRGLGVRIGAEGVEMSYQHSIQKRSFIEAGLGSEFGGFEGIKATGTYNFIFARPAWTNRGYWGIYTGPGMSLGCLDNKFLIAFSAQAGIEYTFWFPLQISIDLRPSYGILGGDFYKRGRLGFTPSLSARFRF